MASKTVLVFCACVGLAIGAAIDQSLSQSSFNPASNIPGMQNGASIAEGFVKIPLSVAKSFANAFQGATGSRAKRQVLDDTSSDGSESYSGSSTSQGFGGIASSVEKGFTNAAKGVAGRFQTAFNETYQDERNSVSDSFNSVKDQIKQNVDTGANLTKTAFDLGTILPKFGKNLIITGN